MKIRTATCFGFQSFRSIQQFKLSLEGKLQSDLVTKITAWQSLFEAMLMKTPYVIILAIQWKECNVLKPKLLLINEKAFSSSQPASSGNHCSSSTMSQLT